MLTQCKTTTFTPNPQMAGVMPNDSSVEFVGNRQTKQVLWLQHGCARYFTDLPVKYFNLLKSKYLKDFKAQRFLRKVTDDFNRQVELFTYYMYGDLDSQPDIQNGELSESENFRDNRNCPSLLWESKNINIGRFVLSPRHLVIVDLIARDLADKAIASALNISIKTLDFHKNTMFRALKVNTKTALLKKAIQHKVIEV